MLDDSLIDRNADKVADRLRGNGDASRMFPVGVSGRHLHVCREHLDILFGSGYELSPVKDLRQPGQ